MRHQFEPTVESAHEARRFVRAALRRWGLQEDDLLLLVSELATNAIVHGRSRFDVVLSRHDRRVRVEVYDHNVRLPTFGLARSDALSGRGLGLVQALASDCGVAPDPAGKTVWCEVELGPASSPGRRLGTGDDLR